MSFLDSLYQRFLPTSPSAPQSDGPTSKTHAAPDAVVRSSLDGSTVLKSEPPATVAEIAAWVRANPRAVLRADRADFVHPSLPVSVIFQAGLPGGEVVIVTGKMDPLWFKRDGYDEVSANRIAAFGRVKFREEDASELIWAMHYAHASLR